MVNNVPLPPVLIDKPMVMIGDTVAFTAVCTFDETVCETAERLEWYVPPIIFF